MLEIKTQELQVSSLTDIIKVPRCKSLRQMCSEDEAGEEGEYHVLDVDGDHAFCAAVFCTQVQLQY